MEHMARESPNFPVFVSAVLDWTHLDEFEGVWETVDAKPKSPYMSAKHEHSDLMVVVSTIKVMPLFTKMEQLLAGGASQAEDHSD